MTDTSSEQFRHACEARHVCALGRINPLRAQAYLEMVAERRGEEASKALREAAAVEWKAQQQRRAA